jgi:hypothetical protein
MDVETALDAIFMRYARDWTGEYTEREAWEVVLAAVETGKLSVNAVYTAAGDAGQAGHNAAAGRTREAFRWRHRGHAEGRGKTLLHFAAGNCSAACVKRLLELGASPSVRDMNDQTPMHLAAASYQALAKCKLLPPCDLNAHDDRLDTPLHIVTWNIRHMKHSPARIAKSGILDVLQWMVQQPECALDDVNWLGATSTSILLLATNDGNAVMSTACGVVQTAMEQRARWSTLRAAWTATVAGAGKPA